MDNMISGLKKKFQNNRFMRIALDLVSRYLNHDVATKAAALAYYLIFSVFPLLILVGNILGLMDFSLDSLGSTLKGILPADVISILHSYLNYIHQTSSPTILTFSIIFSIYFPYRVIRDLMEDVRSAFGLGKNPNMINALLRQLLCTLLIPVTFFLTFILVVAGQNVITFLLSLLPDRVIRLSSFLLNLWQYLRFVLAAVLMAIALDILYQSSLDQRLPWKKTVPGITFAIVFWIIASMAFSFYVENFANYSVIYGTLGAFIVLLLWLYLTGVIFIMGGEVNAALLADENEQALAKSGSEKSKEKA